MYVKVINTSNEPRHVEFAFIGLKKKETVKADECVKFHSDFLYQDNTLDAPEQVVPVKASFTGEGKTLSATVESLTFAVYILTR